MVGHTRAQAEVRSQAAASPLLLAWSWPRQPLTWGDYGMHLTHIWVVLE